MKVVKAFFISMPIAVISVLGYSNQAYAGLDFSFHLKVNSHLWIPINQAASPSCKSNPYSPRFHVGPFNICELTVPNMLPAHGDSNSTRNWNMTINTVHEYWSLGKMQVSYKLAGYGPNSPSCTFDFGLQMTYLQSSGVLLPTVQLETSKVTNNGLRCSIIPSTVPGDSSVTLDVNE